jgi:hypothetical protein
VRLTNRWALFAAATVPAVAGAPSACFQSDVCVRSAVTAQYVLLLLLLLLLLLFSPRAPHQVPFHTQNVNGCLSSISNLQQHQAAHASQARDWMASTSLKGGSHCHKVLALAQPLLKILTGACRSCTGGVWFAGNSFETLVGQDVRTSRPRSSKFFSGNC